MYAYVRVCASVCVCMCVHVYRFVGELRRVVIDVGDGDEGGGRVGEAVVQVALHVRGLDYGGVLGDFLWMGERERERESVIQLFGPTNPWRERRKI